MLACVLCPVETLQHAKYALLFIKRLHLALTGRTATRDAISVVSETPCVPDYLISHGGVGWIGGLASLDRGQPLAESNLRVTRATTTPARTSQP